MQKYGVLVDPYHWANDYRYLNPISESLFRPRFGQPVLQFVRTVASVAAPSHRRKILRAHNANVAFVRAALECADAEVFFDTMKSPTRLYYLLQVPDFDVRVIRFVRDVRAFVRSKARKNVSVAEAAGQWVKHHESVDRLLGAVPKQKILTVRYEDLAHDPEGEMARIHEHVDVTPESLPSNVDPTNHHVLGNSMRLRGPFSVELNEKWRVELSDHTIARALRIAGQMNERYGYHSDDIAQKQAQDV